MNGSLPYQNIAHWLVPEINEIHLFKSKTIWYDPSDYVKDNVIIKADATNLKKYWMDISYLPKEVN